jgi:hypothetical protein
MTASNGIFTLVLKAESINGYTNTAYEGLVDIHATIPENNVLTLRNVRVEYDSAANALAAQEIYVDLPFLTSL